MRTVVYGLFLFVGIGLAGCSTMFKASPETPSLSGHQAIVYLLRTPVITGKLFSTTFKIDGTPVASLHDKEYSWVYLAPGEHHFAATFKEEQGLDFSSPIIAGKTYYIEFGQEIIGKNRIRNVVQMLSPQDGERWVEEYDYEAADSRSCNNC